MGLLVQRLPGIAECEFLAMKHTTLLIWLVTLLLVIMTAGCAARPGDRPPTPSPDWVEGKSIAVRVDSFLWEPDEENRLVAVRVDATVRFMDSAIAPDDLEYALDFGDYTIGTGNTGKSIRDGQPTRVHALFTVSAGSRPNALLINAKETTLRIPLR